MKEQVEEEHVFTQIDNDGNAVGDDKDYEKMISEEPQFGNDVKDDTNSPQ
jgi:hypothetical protein